ncbi:MAG: hypothetical protein BWK80_45110 [Desulfobacteraceae bacterium IS3]|nr:MAG: hypothetical protein BWK80_45110 [Desulfobacteraceae bacterium IS3]
MLWVIDLNSGATESAIILLERLRNANYKCVLIANQIDSIAKNGGKEAIDSAVRSLKEKAYMFPDIYPVCALDSLKGIKNNNPKLVEKSRTPELLAFITEEKSKRQSNAAVLKKKKDYLNLQIKCYNEFIDKKEATRNGLERYIIREALPSLEKRFCDVGFKDTLARCIQDRIEAIEVSPTFNVYKFLLEVKNDTLMYVNALLLVHISNCLGGYAEDIKKKCATELEKFIPEEYQLLPDVSLPDMPGSPDSVNPISEVLKNIIKSMTGLILAIGAGISSLFVTTTTTSLIFFSTTVWNPLGIASIIFFLALSIVTFKSISSPNKKVRENLKSSMKEKFGVNGVNSDDCYSKEGIINMIWNGGRFEEAKDKTGWFSKTTMMITDAGRKLKEEMEKPPALKTVMQEKHIRWAMNQLEISYTERQKIQSEIMMALEETSDVLNEKNNTLPSLRDERRNDFKRIWEGLEPDGTRIKLPNGKYMEGISSELDKIITDIDRRITLLKEEIVSTRS